MRIATIVLPLCGALLGPARLRAQAAAPAGCYGFAFGRWHPELDLAAAGHAPARTDGPMAPNGRSWAAGDAADPAAADSGELILMPAWWPAGVRLRAARLPAVGDTVRGVAVALVADGRATPPRSQALVWGKRCGDAVQTRPDSVAGVAAARARGDTARVRRPTRPRP